ncbi:hypothetical protein GYMLUDRAFT_54361 [Collybiopsis luxurians FD-317 M1]|nr:hypothetical protein GYMLUDRAFT_54361 [Collybiopsis luxurians FD-317 M1]
MALGFSSSSSPLPSTTSTEPSSTSSSAASSSSSSSNGGGGPGFTSKGANYFFGFLVTFIVLLSIFICCGFNTRRRLARRRALFEWGDWGSDANLGNEGPVAQTPTFFEPKFGKGGNNNLWVSIQVCAVLHVVRSYLLTLSSTLLISQPLTASKVTITISRPLLPLEPPPPPIRRPSSNPYAIHGLSLPTWAPSRVIPVHVNQGNDKGKGKGSSTPKTIEDEITLMQVAVVIAMPRPPGDFSEDDKNTDEDHLKTLEIGIASQNWDNNTHIPDGTLPS